MGWNLGTLLWAFVIYTTITCVRYAKLSDCYVLDFLRHFGYCVTVHIASVLQRGAKPTCSIHEKICRSTQNNTIIHRTKLFLVQVIMFNEIHTSVLLCDICMHAKYGLNWYRVAYLNIETSNLAECGWLSTYLLQYFPFSENWVHPWIPDKNSSYFLGKPRQFPVGRILID